MQRRTRVARPAPSAPDAREELANVCKLADELRARGVTRYRSPTGLELELSPPVKASKPLSRSEREQAEETARNRELDDEWRHVGGPPPWVRDPASFRSGRRVSGDGDEEEPS